MNCLARKSKRYPKSLPISNTPLECSPELGLFILFLFTYLFECFVCTLEEGIRFHETIVIDISELTCQCWKLNPGHLRHITRLYSLSLGVAEGTEQAARRQIASVVLSICEYQ